MRQVGSWLLTALAALVAPSLLAAPPMPLSASEARRAVEPTEATAEACENPATVPEEKPDDLTVVLTNWTRIGAAVQTLEARFKRYEFDSTLFVETVAAGRIQYEAGTRALYEIDPPAARPEGRSSRLRPDGTPYQLQVAPPTILYWVHGQFVRADPVRREFELFEIPEVFQTTRPAEAVDSWDIIWTRLGCLSRTVPGLVETDLAALRQRFDWTLIAIDANHIILSAKSRAAAEKRHYSEIHIRLDARTYLPQATKEIDSTRTREVIHLFEGIRVNAPDDPQEPDWAPDLGRMTLLNAPPLAPPATLK
jgi:hypothetical protein